LQLKNERALNLFLRNVLELKRQTKALCQREHKGFRGEGARENIRDLEGRRAASTHCAGLGDRENH
jgi:hypothetical protein